MTEIDRAAWDRAMADVAPGGGADVDDDAMTSIEIGRLFGLGRSATKSRIRKLVELGRVTIRRKHVIDAAGRHQWVPGYVLVTEPVPAPLVKAPTKRR